MKRSLESYLDQILGNAVWIDDCYVWQGRTQENGYGRIGSRYVHRLVFEAVYGPLGRLHVDHLCHNKACVYPGHLALKTRSGNLLNREGAARHSKSGIRGVMLVHDGHRDPWRARVVIEGKIHQEHYPTKEEAAKAVARMRMELV